MKKINKKINFLILVITFVFTNYMISYASNIADTPLFTGTKKLLTDFSTGVTGLIAIVTTGMTLKNCVAWNTAEDEDKPRCKKRVISSIAIGIFGTTVGGLLTVILSYYS